MNNAAESTEKYSAPALSKGLDILELLAEQSSGLKKNEIAFALGRSVSELYRMLVVLVNRDYVNFDGISERYSLSMRLFEMSNRYPPTRRLTDVSGRIMEETASAMNQSVHLAIPYGSNILIVAQVDSPGNNIMLVRLGAQVPMVLTSSGASLLYRMPNPDRRKICAESGEFTEQNMEVFERAVEQVLSTGVCESPSSIIEGVLDLSVPITGYGGDVVAALTVPHVTRLNSVGELGIEEGKQVLIRAGNQISNEIGAGKP